MTKNQELQYYQFQQFLFDARAYIEYGYANYKSSREMLAVLQHDIYGLLCEGKRRFRPRVTGYQDIYPYGTADAIESTERYQKLLKDKNEK